VTAGCDKRPLLDEDEDLGSEDFSEEWSEWSWSSPEALLPLFFFPFC
jgi:hypothetical protein